jgi:hypothetical protein
LKFLVAADDETTLEANAAMKSIVRRDGGATWKACLTRLAKEAGIEDPAGPRAGAEPAEPRSATEPDAPARALAAPDAERVRPAERTPEWWNYGDAPEPRSPTFTFNNGGKAGDKFEVIAVDHGGLESKRSEAADAQ